jgi:ElaB/YqjD/DUF883 family membrane-anchored ribosome-binding protein
MVDEKRQDETAGEDVTLTADPALEAGGGDDGGPAEVSFDAEEDLIEAEVPASPAQRLKDEAAKFGSQAADRARALAGEGKDKVTEALDEVVRTIESAAGDVDAKLGEQYGRYARSAAQGVAGFADTLRGKEVDELIEGAADLVRKSPAIAVGTAATLGFVIARLVKSGLDAAATATGATDDESDATADRPSA